MQPIINPSATIEIVQSQPNLLEKLSFLEALKDVQAIVSGCIESKFKYIIITSSGQYITNSEYLSELDFVKSFGIKKSEYLGQQTKIRKGTTPVSFVCKIYTQEYNVRVLCIWR